MICWIDFIIFDSFDLFPPRIEKSTFIDTELIRSTPEYLVLNFKKKADFCFMFNAMYRIS